jgi:hypothetical protein
MMSWPLCKKSKRIIKVIENCEMTVFGDEMEQWSPKKLGEKNLIMNRVNILLEQTGLTGNENLRLYENVRIIAHHLGIKFFEEDDDDTDTDEDK